MAQNVTLCCSAMLRQTTFFLPYVCCSAMLRQTTCFLPYVCRSAMLRQTTFFLPYVCRSAMLRQTTFFLPYVCRSAMLRQATFFLPYVTCLSFVNSCLRVCCICCNTRDFYDSRTARTARAQGVFTSKERWRRRWNMTLGRCWRRVRVIEGVPQFIFQMYTWRIMIKGG